MRDPTTGSLDGTLGGELCEGLSDRGGSELPGPADLRRPRRARPGCRDRRAPDGAVTARPQRRIRRVDRSRDLTAPRTARRRGSHPAIRSVDPAVTTLVTQPTLRAMAGVTCTAGRDPSGHVGAGRLAARSSPAPTTPCRHGAAERVQRRRSGARAARRAGAHARMRVRGHVLEAFGRQHARPAGRKRRQASSDAASASGSPRRTRRRPAARTAAGSTIARVS